MVAVNLRQAHVIRRGLQAQVKDLVLPAVTLLTIFDIDEALYVDAKGFSKEVQTRVDLAAAAYRTEFEQGLRLYRVLENLRIAIGRANACVPDGEASSMNDILTRIASMEGLIGLVSQAAGSANDVPSEEVNLRKTRELRQNAINRGSAGTGRLISTEFGLDFSAVPSELRDEARKRLSDLRRAKAVLEDHRMRLNYTLTIEIASDDYELLRTLDIV